MTSKKEPGESLLTGMHFSDWGIILIAAMLTAVAAYLLLTPENFAAEFTKAAKTIDSIPQAQKAPGETPAMIFRDDKKK
jgi:hypothetical protein